MTTTITSSNTKALLEAAHWRLTFQGRLATFDVEEMSPLPICDAGFTLFFDSKKMSVVCAGLNGDKDAEHCENRDDRYWRMPMNDGSITCADLRDFVSDQPDVPAEVIDAIWSRRPFRAFKDTATPDLIEGWAKYEDRLNRQILMAFFDENGVTVETVDDGDE